MLSSRNTVLARPRIDSNCEPLRRLSQYRGRDPTNPQKQFSCEQERISMNTWRGLVKQSIQDLLIATIQNLRKLIGAIQNVPQKCLETSDPNSFLVMCDAKRAFHA
jgi:hypothetical protein